MCRKEIGDETGELSVKLILLVLFYENVLDPKFSLAQFQLVTRSSLVEKSAWVPFVKYMYYKLFILS